MRSAATTPDAYLESLPADRRAELAAVREVILEHLPEGYAETVDFGMLAYVVPLERYPGTYNEKPLQLAALAAQRNHLSLYLMCVYGDEERETVFRARFAAAGKRLDMGKSCVRFKRADDLALDAVGEAIAAVGVEEYLERYEAARG
ncbi:DUF1801 domain-containing protein [Actinorhabdospora filicis]|nr:DUF1801 domain-containing protein [Actinorhabdospora filicis]